MSCRSLVVIISKLTLPWNFFPIKVPPWTQFTNRQVHTTLPWRCVECTQTWDNKKMMSLPAHASLSKGSCVDFFDGASPENKQATPPLARKSQWQYHNVIIQNNIGCGLCISTGTKNTWFLRSVVAVVQRPRRKSHKNMFFNVFICRNGPTYSV